MVQVDLLMAIQSIAKPWLDHLMILFSFLGDEQFYMATIPLLYFTVNKRLGVRVALLLALSMFGDEALKVLFASPRPIGVEGIRSLYLSSAPGYSFPSGHTQGSATYWGYLAVQVRKKWFTLLAAAMVLAIGFSRMYLGVHWPLDVLGGLVFGLLFVSAAVVGETKWSQWALGFWTKLLAGAALPVVLLSFYAEAPGQKLMGFWLGCWIGHLLEERFVGMQMPSSMIRRLGAGLIAVGTTFALQSLLKMLLPTLWPAEWHGDLLRYALLGLWCVWVVPWLFVRLGWYRGK